MTEQKIAKSYICEVQLKLEETPMVEMVRMARDKRVTKKELRQRFFGYFSSLEKLK